MRVSFVIVTRNRCGELARTLRHVHRHVGLPPHDWEVWVVDNASSDGTRDLLQNEFPGVHCISLDTNEGTAARSRAFAHLEGEFVVLLDDDSYPLEDTILRSLEHLDSKPQCAAVVGRIELPDGSLEACALPSVMLSGAVCLRKSILDRVGGFRSEFFRKAGEYDLSWRIWQAGYLIERFEDLIYRHDKAPSGRDPAFSHRMDIRNNLILCARFLPLPMRRAYRRDWLRRYAALAAWAGQHASISTAVSESRQWARRERQRGREILSERTLETIFQWKTQHRTIRQWAQELSIKHVIVADCGKNLYATHRACVLSGLSMIAIADDHPAFTGRHYRGLPIVANEDAQDRRPQGVILSNINPAQVDRRMQELEQRFNVPVLRLWRPRLLRNYSLQAPVCSSLQSPTIVETAT